ncbi:MAG: replicative DNA helicase, partial [Muribaculaceae bacterium]|nr:replicative DNA helicase [Muribaculaceae bacterium]
LVSLIKGHYSAPRYIDDSPGLSILELRTKARRLVREKGVEFIIIDYLQLMNASGMKFGSREQEVSMISRSLKELAKELNIPIVALSQLNRSVESRSEDKRPQLSDLRESGAIEQDADIVCFIHRPEYYLHGAARDESPELRGKAEFIIAKHRSGSVEDVPLRFRAKFARFENWDEAEARFGSATASSALNGAAIIDDDPLGGAPAPLAGGSANIAGGGDDTPF